jgi:hypothetical protein
MAKTTCILKYFIVFLILSLALSCAPAKKNTFYQKKKSEPHLSSERMGRNKYFFSPNYQKKLNHSYKKR